LDNWYIINGFIFFQIFILKGKKGEKIEGKEIRL